VDQTDPVESKAFYGGNTWFTSREQHGGRQSSLKLPIFFMTREFWTEHNIILMYTHRKRGVLRIFTTLVCVHHFFSRSLVTLNDNYMFQAKF